MNRGRRDIVVIALAVAGVVGALSLAGIFIVYLVDTIGGEDSTSAQPTGTSGPQGLATPPASGVTGQTTQPPQGSNGSNAGQPPAAAQGANPKLNRIPDNQVYETFRNSSGGYSILFPKGWTKTGERENVSFTSNRNFEHIVSSKGKAPTIQSVQKNIKSDKGLALVTPPRMININGQRVIKLTVRQLGVRQASGSPVRLFIDQYHFARGNKNAVVDLATTGAVRNANSDDYQKIIQSFRWN